MARFYSNAGRSLGLMSEHSSNSLQTLDKLDQSLPRSPRHRPSLLERSIRGLFKLGRQLGPAGIAADIQAEKAQGGNQFLAVGRAVASNVAGTAVGGTFAGSCSAGTALIGTLACAGGGLALSEGTEEYVDRFLEDPVDAVVTSEEEAITSGQPPPIWDSVKRLFD